MMKSTFFSALRARLPGLFLILLGRIPLLSDPAVRGHMPAHRRPLLAHGGGRFLGGAGL